jgi:hypothetical protein
MSFDEPEYLRIFQRLLIKFKLDLNETRLTGILNEGI